MSVILFIVGVLSWLFSLAFTLFIVACVIGIIIMILEML